MNQTIQINLQVKLIQELRLIHALAEADYDIAIPATEIHKFELLNKKFGVNFNQNATNNIDLTDAIQIGHVAPNTYFGNILRSLIFPHALTNFCFTLWQENRKNKFSFQGLITAKRKSLIENWIRQNITTKKVSLPTKNNLFIKVRNKVLRTFGINNAIKTKIGDLVVWSSEKGRYYPFKAFDEEYFKELANSKFVLCPSGDCVWSYRFFEAILCGAIPIVEQHCEAYNGFTYFTFNTSTNNLIWDKQIAEFNYKLCLERITIPKDILNLEIDSMIKNYNKI
ncbi:MAG: exostosin family protein [Bacteroidota bacterium]|jgi:hypothetical protein